MFQFVASGRASLQQTGNGNRSSHNCAIRTARPRLITHRCTFFGDGDFCVADCACIVAMHTDRVRPTLGRMGTMQMPQPAQIFLGLPTVCRVANVPSLKFDANRFSDRLRTTGYPRGRCLVDAIRGMSPMAMLARLLTHHPQVERRARTRRRRQAEMPTVRRLTALALARAMLAGPPDAACMSASARGMPPGAAHWPIAVRACPANNGAA